jgi:hypothetical protein
MATNNLEAVDYHALSSIEMAQYLPKLRHRRKTADDGLGPRVFLSHPTSWNQLTTVRHLGIVQNCSVCQIKVPDLGMEYTEAGTASVGPRPH